MKKATYTAVAPWASCGHRHRTWSAAKECGLRLFRRGGQIRIAISTRWRKEV